MLKSEKLSDSNFRTSPSKNKLKRKISFNLNDNKILLFGQKESEKYFTLQDVSTQDIVSD